MNYELFLSTEVIDVEAALIRRLSMCDFSHCGFRRQVDGWTYSAMNDGLGVALRPPNPQAKILSLTLPNVDEIAAIAFTQEGKPYNRKAIAGFAFNRDWSQPDAFDCDQLVFWAAIKFGTPLVNHTFIPLEHLTPRDVLLCTFITKK